MSTLTLSPTSSDAAVHDETQKSSPGLIARLIERSTAAQTARARQIVYRHLSSYSDSHLADLGFTPAEVADIRKAGQSPVAYWA